MGLESLAPGGVGLLVLPLMPASLTRVASFHALHRIYPDTDPDGHDYQCAGGRNVVWRLHPNRLT